MGDFKGDRLVEPLAFYENTKFNGPGGSVGQPVGPLPRLQCPCRMPPNNGPFSDLRTITEPLGALAQLAPLVHSP